MESLTNTYTENKAHTQLMWGFLNIRLTLKFLSLWIRFTAFQVSILPPLASIFVTGVAAQFADHLIANGVEVTTVSRDWTIASFSLY
jgi:hypothetical protein